MLAIRAVGPVVCGMWLVGCADATAPESVPEVREIELLVDASHGLQLPDAPAGSLPVAAGLFMTIPASLSKPLIAPAVVADRARRLIADTNGILAQCELHLVMEAVQVIAVPPHLITVQGNERGSWGGHPPDSVGDPDVFMYDQNERLTSDTRELFGYGKRYTSKNAIAIFIVQEIEYYIGEQRTGAGGLSFSPVTYHHADDYPLRNSVLVVLTGRDPTGLPFASGRVLAHELGHMLLNTGDHVGDAFGSLMVGGATLSSEQCVRMRTIRERLFGDDAVPDPGRPDAVEP